MNWGTFVKEASALPGDLVDQVSTAALTRWADSPSGIDKEAREALCASLVGARLVDAAIEKLALSPEDRDYLRALNEEAGARDIALLTKQALMDPRIGGALLGAGVGAGLGAWKDDENRLRGAALYAVPGAAIGAVGGAIAGEFSGRAKALAEDAAAVADATRNEAAAHAASRSVALARLNGAIRDGERWHQNLIHTAAALSEHGNERKTPGIREFAAQILPFLGARKQEIVAAHVAQPGSLPRDLWMDHTANIPYMSIIHEAAKTLHTNTPL